MTILVVLRHDDVRIGVQLVDLLSSPAASPTRPATFEMKTLSVERLQQVLVGARLQLLVLLERRQRLLAGDRATSGTSRRLGLRRSLLQIA